MQVKCSRTATWSMLTAIHQRLRKAHADELQQNSHLGFGDCNASEKQECSCRWPATGKPPWPVATCQRSRSDHAEEVQKNRKKKNREATLGMKSCTVLAPRRESSSFCRHPANR